MQVVRHTYVFLSTEIWTPGAEHVAFPHSITTFPAPKHRLEHRGEKASDIKMPFWGWHAKKTPKNKKHKSQVKSSQNNEKPATFWVQNRSSSSDWNLSLLFVLGSKEVENVSLGLGLPPSSSQDPGSRPSSASHFQLNCGQWPKRSWALWISLSAVWKVGQ